MLRVLMIHARYRGQGGEDVSVAVEGDLLRRAGVQADTLIFDPVPERLASGPRALWNPAAFQAVRRRLADAPADIVHVQNLFPAGSVAVLHAATGHGVPVVQTLRNHRPLCPAGTLWRPAAGTCPTGLGPSCLRHGCWHGSRVATAVALLAAGLPRWSGAWRRVARFVTPSAYLRDALAPVIPPERVRVVPNRLAADPGPGRPSGARAGILYAGRLTEEKGVPDLLAAAQRLGPAVPLRLLGDGPLAPAVRQAAAVMPWVRWDGPVPHTAVLDAMGRAAAVVVPSRWAEPFGRTTLEGLACGAAVVAARVGGLPEVVGPAGVLVPPGDPEALAAGMQEALARAPALGKAGRRRYRRLTEGGAGPLLSVYEEVLALQRTSHRNASAAKTGTVTR